MRHGDLFPHDDLGQIARILMAFGPCHHEHRTLREWPEELPYRHIESEWCLL